MSGFTSVNTLPKIARLPHNKTMQSGCNLPTKQWKQFDKNHLTVEGTGDSEMLVSGFTGNGYVLP